MAYVNFLDMRLKIVYCFYGGYRDILIKDVLVTDISVIGPFGKTSKYSLEAYFFRRNNNFRTVVEVGFQHWIC